MAASIVTSKRSPVTLSYRTADHRGAECSPGLVYAVDELEQFTRTAPEPVELADYDNIATGQRRHQLGELRPVGAGHPIPFRETQCVRPPSGVHQAARSSPDPAWRQERNR
jgi:hypothetical protein